MDESYAEVGTWVILGRHKRYTSYGLEWNPDMEKYVGKKTKIKKVYFHSDPAVCRVSCDRGYFYWRVEDMILASDVPLLTPRQKWELKIHGH